MEYLTFVQCKRGRRFQTNKPVAGRQGVMVEGIRKTGNFVQVDFRMMRGAEGVAPGPVVLHVDDVRSSW